MDSSTNTFITIPLPTPGSATIATKCCVTGSIAIIDHALPFDRFTTLRRDQHDVYDIDWTAVTTIFDSDGDEHTVTIREYPGSHRAFAETPHICFQVIGY